MWLTDSEIEDLRRATSSQRDDLIIQLGAFVGLRAFEIPQVRPVDVTQTESGQYRLRVHTGKDTSGNGGKPRDAYLPDSVGSGAMCASAGSCHEVNLSSSSR